MTRDIREVLTSLKKELSSLYGERLKGVYLFGSYARGEADEESDIDVLIVLDRVDNYSQEIDRTSELIARLSLECDRSISCVFVPEERWKHEETMFLINVREEAVRA